MAVNIYDMFTVAMQS